MTQTFILEGSEPLVIIRFPGRVALYVHSWLQQQHQEAPKWIAGFHMCSCLSLLCKSSPHADQGQLLLMDSHSSRLLVPGHTELKAPWQQLQLVIQWGPCYSLWHSVPSLGTWTPNLQNQELWVQEAQNSSVGHWVS